MLEIHDHVSEATRTRLAWRLDTGTTLGDAMMDAVRQYADLNLNMARATLGQGNFAVRQLVSARDSRQFLSLAAAQMQPATLRNFDYGYYLTSITADTQTQVIRAAGDGFAETNREWFELAGKAAEGGPYGWKTAVAFFKDLAENVLRVNGGLAGTLQSALFPEPPPGTAATRVAYAGRVSAHG